ncbi:MAG: hypothetical protein ABSC19_00450 [Syntrophorhabdales bacterium]
MRLVLFSALSREVRETTRMLGGRTRLQGLPFRAFCVRHPSHSLTFAETGMGIESATRVFLHMLQRDRPDAAISLGYCGSLSPDASIGDLIWASKVCLVEGRGVETLALDDALGVLGTLSSRLPIRAGTFLTLNRWRKKHELVRTIPQGMPLPVCDMETFGLARLSVDHGLPFFAIRAVSDASGEDIPFDPWSVCDSSGTYRLYRALGLFLSRPHLLAHAIKLRRNSKIASRNLALAVSALLQIL